MKKLFSLVLVIVLILTGCASPIANSSSPVETEKAMETAQNAIAESDFNGITTESTIYSASNVASEPNQADNTEASDSTDPNIELTFSGLNDPKLLQYVEDTVYANLVEEFASEDYIIENVKAINVSKEYIEEVSYNSRANIFFGYTLAELDAQFQGTRYVFTLGANGETTVIPFEAYDNTYEKVLKNVAIGTGAILVCVTVSVVTGGAGLASASMVFAASAKTANAFALSGTLFGGVSAGIVEGIRTGDFDSALKAAALNGSEGFKWGAISGTILGGISKLSAIRRAGKAVDGAPEYAQGTVEITDDLAQWRQAELQALNETGGYEQLAYLKGKRVPYSTKGATRPDVVRMLDDHIEAIEVKYCNLENQACLNSMYNQLKREITARVDNLPSGSTQKIILNVTGRGFSEATCNAVKTKIWSLLDTIYPRIPIEIVGLRP